MPSPVSPPTRQNLYALQSRRHPLATSHVFSGSQSSTGSSASTDEVDENDGLVEAVRGIYRLWRARRDGAALHGSASTSRPSRGQRPGVSDEQGRTDSAMSSKSESSTTVEEGVYADMPSSGESSMAAAQAEAQDDRGRFMALVARALEGT